jgi:hypothetical protein
MQTGRGRIAVAVLGVSALAASCTFRAPDPVPSRILSPAPRLTGSFGECVFAPPRASSISPEALANVMEDHVPRWLPDGMGLVMAFAPGWGAKGGAFFSDERCREIELWFWRSTAVGSGQEMGAWRVSVSGPDACENPVLGNARCIEYHARVAGGSIGVQMMGIPRSEGDRIVDSIPV